MSIGPSSGIIGSVAGAPLAQSKGSELERASQVVTAHQRQAQSDAAAENAAGIGQTSEDQQSSERDADGRRLWEIEGEQAKVKKDAAPLPQQSRDATGTCGRTLDLTG